jgi:tRNA (guanine-N7-)-methyltransferase
MSRLRNIPGSVDVIRASEYVIHDPEAKKGHWAEVFGDDHPLYIEIGMGKGRFLMDMAQKYPEKNFVGIEMYDSVMFRAVQKAELRTERARAVREGRDPESVTEIPAGVTERPGRPQQCNFRFIRMDARKLCEVFARGEVDGIFLNFSDPWPKDRHESRRLTSRNFLALYEAVMNRDAELAFKTDNRDLFAFSLAEIPDSGWELKAYTFDLHNNEKMNRGNVMTEYEEKFSSKGNPICKLIAAPVRE